MFHPYVLTTSHHLETAKGVPTEDGSVNDDPAGISAGNSLLWSSCGGVVRSLLKMGSGFSVVDAGSCPRCDCCWRRQLRKSRNASTARTIPQMANAAPMPALAPVERPEWDGAAGGAAVGGEDDVSTEAVAALVGDADEAEDVAELEMMFPFPSRKER
jgi:hypothetical protein